MTLLISSLASCDYLFMFGEPLLSFSPTEHSLNQKKKKKTIYAVISHFHGYTGYKSKGH